MRRRCVVLCGGRQRYRVHGARMVQADRWFLAKARAIASARLAACLMAAVGAGAGLQALVSLRRHGRVALGYDRELVTGRVPVGLAAESVRAHSGRQAALGGVGCRAAVAGPRTADRGAVVVEAVAGRVVLVVQEPLRLDLRGPAG